MEEKAKLGPSSQQTQLLEQVLAKLDKVSRYENYAMALCPFHPDHNPSLKVTKRGFYCFGCKERGSLSKLAKKLGIDVQEEKSSAGLEQSAIEYVASRLMLSDEQAKNFMQRWNIQAGKYGNIEGIYIDLFNGDKKFRSIEGKEYRHIGNSDEPAFAGLIDLFESHTVVITEGTFDALTFLRYDIPVISLEGKKYSVEKALDVIKSKGIGRVVIAFDNDEAGESYKEETIKKALQKGFIVLMFDIPQQYKDVNEFFVSDKAGFKKSIENLERNNVFNWCVERNRELLDSVERQRLLYAKLVAIYDQASDKKTAHELLLNALLENGLSYDEWLAELEHIEIIKANNEKREQFIKVLKQTASELEGGADLVESAHNLLLKLDIFTPIDARTIDEDTELLEDGFPESERFRFKLIDDVRLYPSDLLLISAKTKAGKTTLALNLFHEILEQGLKALYVTYELTKTQIYQLFCALDLQKDWLQITKDDKRLVAQKFSGIAMIRHNLSLEEIIALVNTFRPHAFFIDYDQQVQVKGRFDSEERRVAYIVRTLKALAIDKHALAVLLSQENEDERARYSREKEFYASVHLHLDKDDNAIKYEVRLNRYGPAGMTGAWNVDFSTRKMSKEVKIGSTKIRLGDQA